MTLTVDAFRRDENDDIVWLPMASDLAGFNSTRFSFYGGKAAIDAGLVLLPTLRDASPLWVSGSDLELLRREVLTLRTLVPSDAIEYWEFRLNNILRAIDEAEKYGAAGGVCIG